MSHQMKEDHYKPLAERILNFISEEMKANHNLNCGEVTLALIIVLTGYVAGWRAKGRSMAEMAEWLASTVHKKYIDAHLHMAQEEAKRMPGG